ncbi:MAG: GNAT family protein [Eubacteriales bacterium]|nr:GNAT family protein [Eubacteriales bacterium]MDD3198276.1 GNAT family protein [Eubacteriales bacterium]MDD4681551.1 GNAT family protein [Eubacteriales bacterium]
MINKNVMGSIPLSGARIKLTALHTEDLPLLQVFFSDMVALSWYLPTTARPMNLKQLDKLLTEWNDGISCFVFAVRVEDRLIGLINLDDVDFVNSHAEIGIALTDYDSRGQGLAKEAIETLINYAFAELGLHRIWARIIAGNAASIKLFASVGFKLEGKMRQHVRRHGEWLDMTVWGLLNNDCADMKD